MASPFRRRLGRVAAPLSAVLASYLFSASPSRAAPCEPLAVPKVAPPVPINPPSGRRRVVVLGSGWGAVSFLRNLKLDPATTELTVVSPRGYFLYSPLLPAAAVGSVETRSITEPIRSLLPPGASFVEAAATRIDPVTQTVSCSPALDASKAFALGYDILIFACGSVPTTFGTPGVLEHCLFLKSAADAGAIKARLYQIFERASLPGTSEAERDRLLRIVICGGGPTGAELAAELRDLITVDLVKLYPTLAPRAEVVVVDSNSHVLSMFDRKIAEYATSKFLRDGIRLVLQARVTGVDGEGVQLLHKADKRTEKLPAGLVVWATGVALHPLAAALSKSIPAQTNTRALIVDDRLAVRGTSRTIYALGDAATLEQSKALAHAESLFKEFDADSSGTLEVHELATLLEKAATRFPQFEEHVRLFKSEKGDANSSSAVAKEAVKHTATIAAITGFGAPVASGGVDVSDTLRAVFAAADKDGSGGLELGEFRELLAGMDKHLRALPATAQVARQQGVYLAGVANAGHLGSPDGAPPFTWTDMGSMAFLGKDEAVAKLPGVGVVQGMAAAALWRGFETSNQQSWRNRAAVSIDMARTKIFGRDVSTIRSKA